MDEITVISLVVLVVALLLPFLTESLSGNHRLLKEVKYLIFFTYVFVNLYETLLFRVITPNAQYELGLLWSYRKALSVYNGSEFRIFITDGKLLKAIILNILLYVPLGYLLPFIWPGLDKTRHGEWSGSRFSKICRGFPWKIVFIGLLCSAVTELLQLAFHIGLFEFDDILNNTIGCFLGVIVSRVLKKSKGSVLKMRQMKWRNIFFGKHSMRRVLVDSGIVAAVLFLVFVALPHNETFFKFASSHTTDLQKLAHSAVAFVSILLFRALLMAYKTPWSTANPLKYFHVIIADMMAGVVYCCITECMLDSVYPMLLTLCMFIMINILSLFSRMLYQGVIQNYHSSTKSDSPDKESRLL